MIAGCQALCQMHAHDPDELHVFLDFLSIPQKNMRLRLCAIDSLGVIASVCQYFMVVAPPKVHTGTRKLCDKTSYSRRGWCRLEQWGHLCTRGMSSMYFYDGALGRILPLDDSPEDEGEDWFLDSIMVYEGDYTNPDNKAEMLDVVLGLYAMVLHSHHSNANLARLYRLIMSHTDRVFPREYFADLPEELAKMVEHDDEMVENLSSFTRRSSNAFGGWGVAAEDRADDGSPPPNKTTSSIQASPVLSVAIKAQPAAATATRTAKSSHPATGLVQV